MQLTTERYDFDAVLFDLDGTLLQTEMATYIPRYIHALSEFCADQVEPERFEKALFNAIRNLIYEEGNGRLTNEERVFLTMKREIGLDEAVIRDSFEHFKQNGLDDLKDLVKPVPPAQKIIEDCADTNVPLVLATNPVHPRFMIQARVRWAGLDETLFTHITSLENSYHCKPQPGYFTGLAAMLGVAPERCLMIGNDINHDLAAVGVGMKAYLVDTWLVEREDPEWPIEYRGDHRALQQFLSHHLGQK